MIAQLRPQIVLIDLILPGIGGMELLQQIVQLEWGIAVILMTGHNSPELAKQAIQMGAADYFPKPFSPRKLRERIELIVQDKKRRQRSSTMDGIAEKQREALREI
jgi:DNA-binding NtrC family response regulator